MQEWCNNYIKCVGTKTGKKLFFNKAYGGWRLYAEEGAGAREMSPRVTKKEMEDIVYTLMNAVQDLPDIVQEEDK